MRFSMLVESTYALVWGMVATSALMDSVEPGEQEMRVSKVITYFGLYFGSGLWYFDM
jgi:hypothetical protein